MQPKTYLRLLQAGLFLSLIIVFFVFRDLLFPFITSKQLVFNILMEAMFVFWLVFILRYPAYRPKRNLMTYGLVAYFVALLASCVVSVNFALSFWGNAERMLGFFDLIHFLIFYLVLITAFRSWKEWRALFFVSVAIGTVVALVGLLGTNAYSTIGNTTYVSGYLIFNIYFATLLFFRTESKGGRWLYALPIVIMLLAFWHCHTSGAIIGLAGSVLLWLLLLVIFHARKRVRFLSLGVLILAVVLVGLIFSQSGSAWFQSSFLRGLTTQKNTFQTRLISWRGALADYKYHPILGTGLGNYAIIFDRHFDPKFFNYTTSETYFDRAHNNVLDILSTSGAVGLLTYLSIFVAALYYLAKELKKNGVKASGADEAGKRNGEILLIIALLVAYFVQNLAVFDSLVTYMGLMMILAFIYFRRNTGLETEGGIIELDSEGASRPLLKNFSREWLALIALGIIALIAISNWSIRPWKDFQGVIAGYSAIAQSDLPAGVKDYQAALTGSPWDHDGAVTLINLLTSNPGLLATVSAPEAQAALDLALALAQKNLTNNPNDSLMQLQYAQISDTAARYYHDNKDLNKYNAYSAQALQAIDRSIDASPGRIPVYLVKVQMLFVRGETNEALSLAKYAINLNPDYYESYCRLAQLDLILDGQNKNALEPLDKCLALGGVEQINSDSFLKMAISFYASQRKYEQALSLTEHLVGLYGNDAMVWFNLAKIYVALGQPDNANAAAQKAMAIDETYQARWQDFMDSLGRTVTSTATGTKK